MKFISSIHALAKEQNVDGLYNLLDFIAGDPHSYSSEFPGFGCIDESHMLYYYYSEGEVAFMMVDNDGCADELADEEEFNDEVAMWFSEYSHRISPLTRLRTLMMGFIEVMDKIENVKPDNYVCILLTKSNVINYDEYEPEFDRYQSVVFHNFKGFGRRIPFGDNDAEGRTYLDQFYICCRMERQLNNLFDRYRKYDKENDIPAPTGDPATEKKSPFSLTNYFKEEDLDDFFSLEDPDFKTTEQVVNAETGEKLTVKRDVEMPPVNILEPIVDPHSFLSEMVGLKDLKTNMMEIVSYARYMTKVKDTFPNYAHQPINLHTLITGNPGTGKTTMCRIYGGLLHQAGLISKGHTVVAGRGSFIGQQFGTEELRMRQILKLAQGGCLFVDEAAQLFDTAHPHDPGRNVVQLMLQLLADEANRDIAVVLALYANDKSLERLYELNPGIKSRFVNVLNFPDYSLNELINIARSRAKAQGLTFTPKAWRQFCLTLKTAYDNRDRNFGNAREAVNLLEKCVIRHAVRCERHNLSGSDLLRITFPDIPQMIPAMISNRKLGFS